MRGNNILIVRNTKIAEIINTSLVAGEIDLRPSSPDEFYLSQSANYRHKIDGLSYRLIQSNKVGEWVPKKRVSVDSNNLKLSKRRMKALAIRSILRDESHSRYARCRVRRCFEVSYSNDSIDGQIPLFCWFFNKIYCERAY